MTAAYGSHSLNAYAARTNNTTIVPSGTVDGNLLIWMVVTGNATPITPTFPAGWTAIGGSQTGADASSFDYVAVTAWRIASSEPANYTATHAAASGSEGLMVRITGSGTLSIDASSFTVQTINNGTTVAASCSPATSDALLLFFGMNWNNAALTPPTGMTERLDSAFGYLATQALSASGATGTRSQSHGTHPWYGNLIAIKDVSSGNVGAASGTGTGSGVGSSLAKSPGSAAGTSTVTATGRSNAASAGSAAATATVSGIGRGNAASVGSSSGTSTVAAVGKSLSASVGSSSGAGTGTAVATSPSTGAATGVGTGTGVSSAVSAASGSASGTGTASGSGTSRGDGTGTASGGATVTGIGSARASSAGSSSATGSALGVSSAGTVSSAAGTAAGVCSAGATGRSTSAAIGSSSGSSNVVAIGTGLITAAGSVAATSSATGAGAYVISTVGVSAGFGVAMSIGHAVFDAVGEASGISGANGVVVIDAVPDERMADVTAMENRIVSVRSHSLRIANVNDISRMVYVTGTNR